MQRLHTWLTYSQALTALLGIVGVAGCSSSVAPVVRSAPNTVVIDMTSNNLFSPTIAIIAAGDIVQFTNSGTDSHAPVVDPGNVAPGGPNSDLLFPNGVPSGQSYRWTSPADAPSGTRWYYHCRFHGLAGTGTELGSGMVGYIVVQ